MVDCFTTHADDKRSQTVAVSACPLPEILIALTAAGMRAVCPAERV